MNCKWRSLVLLNKQGSFWGGTQAIHCQGVLSWKAKFWWSLENASVFCNPQGGNDSKRGQLPWIHQLPWRTNAGGEASSLHLLGLTSQGPSLCGDVTLLPGFPQKLPGKTLVSECWAQTPTPGTCGSFLLFFTSKKSSLTRSCFIFNCL